MLSPAIFAADNMVVADGDLMDPTVAKLKAELKERGEKRTGNKPWLRRRDAARPPRSAGRRHTGGAAAH